MERRIIEVPGYIEAIKSIDLTLAGKCNLAAFAAAVIEIADQKTSRAQNIVNPFSYFRKICADESAFRGLEVDNEFAADLLRLHKLSITSPYLNSSRISKIDPRRTMAKPQEYTGPTRSDVRSAIRKQIEATKTRANTPIDRSGLDEFIKMHQAGEIKWENPKAKEFADILVGAALHNKHEMAQGKPFVNPISALVGNLQVMSPKNVDLDYSLLDEEFHYYPIV